MKPFEETPAKPEAALAELIQDAYRITESNYFRTIYCASLAKLDFKDSFPDADYPALVGGAAADEASRTWRRDARDGAAGRYRCHAAAGSIPAPQPPRAGYSGAALGRRPSVGGAVARALVDGRRIRPAVSCTRAARSEAIARVPWHKRRAFVRKLDRLRRFVWLREEMRDLSSRMYYLIRRRVLQIAERRGLGDDIFFMTFREILNDDRSTIAGAAARSTTATGTSTRHTKSGRALRSPNPRPRAR